MLAQLEHGILTLGPNRYRATLGAGGVRADKREGDGATPRGLLPLRRVLYRADRVARPRATAPVHPLGPQDGWCDDPADARYNQPVTTPYPARHEALWRADGLYDIIGVLGWNDAPVERGRGSAIFLHVSRADGGPTAGCVGLALPDLQAVLAAGLTELQVA